MHCLFKFIKNIKLNIYVLTLLSVKNISTLFILCFYKLYKIHLLHTYNLKKTSLTCICCCWGGDVTFMGDWGEVGELRVWTLGGEFICWVGCCGNFICSFIPGVDPE